MKKINVRIEGNALLMNSPKQMLLSEGRTRSKLKEIDHKEEAEKLAYWMDKPKTKGLKKELYVPQEAVMGALLNGAKWKKSGKFALRPIIAGAVRIEPLQIPLGTNKYELDIRTVVIQRARVPKARPRIDNWKAEFEIIYNEQMIPDPDVIRSCLEEAGERVGILDFRAEKGGPFGSFKVVKWVVRK